MNMNLSASNTEATQIKKTKLLGLPPFVSYAFLGFIGLFGIYAMIFGKAKDNKTYVYPETSNEGRIERLISSRVTISKFHTIDLIQQVDGNYAIGIDAELEILSDPRFEGLMKLRKLLDTVRSPEFPLKINRVAVTFLTKGSGSDGLPAMAKMFKLVIDMPILEKGLSQIDKHDPENLSKFLSTHGSFIQNQHMK